MLKTKEEPFKVQLHFLLKDSLFAITSTINCEDSPGLDLVLSPSMSEMGSEVIVVAVDASKKKISDQALKWAICNVVKPGDSLIFLAATPSRAKGVRHFLSVLLNIGKTSTNRIGLDRKNVCQQVLHRVCSSHNITQVQTEVKIMAAAKRGSVATTALQLEANWVILDWQLKKESDSCLKQSNCNVVQIDRHFVPKLLRVVNNSTTLSFTTGLLEDTRELPALLKSYGQENSFAEKSLSSSSTENHATVPSDDDHSQHENMLLSLESDIFYKENEARKPYRAKSAYSKSQPLNRLGSLAERKNHSKSKSATSALMAPSRRSGNLSKQSSLADRTSSIRKAISISIRQPPCPPPLCSICKQNSPFFGKAPRKFSYKEIEQATERFSSKNFLAEGRNGPVYKGVLPDGLVVAVKQHKTLNAQGASELCSEVEVLSCAQHRNLVMLVGYCIDKEWFLVYEYACNGSLDTHMFGEETSLMTWDNRMKVALGAARGLRYLHEDCRVGSIIHRDFKPNNILLTHDFEPMVGDFGLARCQADGELAEETRVMGSYGYLAPEDSQTGLVSDKSDVYAFGVVLLELLSGSKATELLQSSGHQSLHEWAHAQLHPSTLMEMIDVRLQNIYNVNEAEWMMLAAKLCIHTNHEERPRMSKVLKILEGDTPMENMGYDHHEMQIANQHKATVLEKNSRAVKQITFPKHDWNLDRSEVFISEEYETYIQGSLAKFIQDLNNQQQHVI